MKILVTRGLGAVGAPLTERLRARGDEVWVLDRPHHHGLNGPVDFVTIAWQREYDGVR